MEEYNKSSDVVIGMLQVFSTFVYALLDPRSTLSFVSSLLALTFEILPDVLNDPIVVSIILGENVRTKRVYKDFPIVVCGKTMCANLVELPMHDLMLIVVWPSFIVVMLLWIVVIGLYDCVSLMKKI